MGRAAQNETDRARAQTLDGPGRQLSVQSASLLLGHPMENVAGPAHVHVYSIIAPSILNEFTHERKCCFDLMFEKWNLSFRQKICLK